MITLRTASDADVPAIVALLNAAFAMERSFIDRDRTSAPEIERYMTTGTFSVVDGTASVVDGTASALASCMYLEQRKIVCIWGCWPSTRHSRGAASESR
jgi:hypothetical protein